MLAIKSFNETDTPFLIQLFQKTVHTVCKIDYSLEQLNSWAPQSIDCEQWNARFSNSFTVVAWCEDRIVGFANLEINGYIDMFYVSAFHQRKGIGNLLLKSLETEAKRQGINQIFSDVSITAKQFFLANGYSVKKEYTKFVGKICFLNSIMEKDLKKMPTNII